MNKCLADIVKIEFLKLQTTNVCAKSLENRLNAESLANAIADYM